MSHYLIPGTQELAIQAGDKVVCMSSLGQESKLTEGKIYSVTKVVKDEADLGESEVYLEANDAGKSSSNYYIKRFKKFEQPNPIVSGGKKTMDTLKNFFNKHQDIILTVGLVLLVDYFLFNGALRARIQATIEKVLGNVEKKLASNTQE